MQLIAKILLKKLLSCGGWNEYKNYYISELFPALFRDPEKGSKEEKELLLQIKENVSKDEWENLENYLEEILNSHCSINDSINEVKQLISNGDFDKADELYNQIKNLSINTLLPYEYENIKNNFCQNTKNLINYLLERYKFEEAEKLYSKYSKVLNYSDFNHVEGGYLKRQEKDVFINKLDYLLQSGKFFESDTCFNASSNLLSVSEYEEIKSGYIKKFFKDNFKKVNELSDEQFFAVADISQNLLLRARAGSGKTTTLSSKIAYLIRGEKIDQNKIVSLCFNSAATKNIIKKLRDDFDIKYREKENIATFHSLAGQISPAKKEVETLFDDRDPLSKQKLTAFVEEILKKKWDEPFLDLEKEDISNTSDSIVGFIKKILVKFKYATYKNVVYAIAREDKRFDTDEEADELENKAILYGSREHYLYRRNLSYITLDGKHVKSFGEKCIADYLFEHDIKYKYESNFRMGNHTYYPDFELYENKIIIEHWGIDESDKLKRVPKNWSKTWDDYVREMGDKRAYWKAYTKNGAIYNLLETNITQLKSGREEFETKISNKLRDYGVYNARLSLEEIIKKLSHNLRSEFSKKIVSYFQKAKQDGYSSEEMKLKISEAGYPKYSKVNVFLNLANEIYKQYEIDKEKEKKIDFYDYLSNAEREINTNEGNCKLRSGVSISEIEWLLIDEFQDFSPLFMALVKVIQKYNSKVKLFCVGDDWQAINSFAGSDVELFNEFEREFPVNSAVKNLTINWRSNQGVVNFGNKIMTGHGVESSANPSNRENAVIEHRNINEGWIEIKEVKAEFGVDTDIDVVLLRYLDHAVKIIDTYLKSLKDDKEFKILILSRKSRVKQYTLDDFIKKIEVFFIKKYPEDKNKIKVLFDKQTDKKESEYRQVESKTAHQSKGLEANVVIVLEATNRCFPLIHPDSLLFEIFGDTLDKIEDEERRLFYVACTRAKSDLYLLYEKDFDRKKSLTEFYPQ